MAAVIKVKPKKTFEWNQDKKYVYVQVPLHSHTSLKKVDIFLADLILRVTSREKNQTQTLDLAQEIDCHSPDNKFILSNGLLHATLKKGSPDSQWSQLLVEGISLEELRDRRKESQRRYEEHVKTVEQNKSKIRIDYEQKATRQLMRFQGEEREKLEHKKRVEKEEAINSVFSNVNQKNGSIQKKNTETRPLELERTQNVWKEKEQLALTMLQEEQAQQRARKEQQRLQKNKSKIIEQVTKQYQGQIVPSKTKDSMFTAEDIENYDQMRQNVEQGIEYEQIPVRKAATQKVTFTERIHKNLAARDTFHKEPPMPKNQSNKITNGDVESKNPLWLKDKGDSFLKDKNYVSAIQAYSEALKADSKLFGAVMNRSVCYMRVFRLQDAINDCDQGLILLQSQISGDEQEQMHSRLILAKIKTRKAICCAWKGELDVAKNILNQVLQLDLTEDIKSQVNGCLQQIKKRQASIQSKAKGDQLVRVNNHEAAVQHYNEAIETDENQYALSNKVLCLNKLKKYQQAAQEAEKCIKRLSHFNISSSSLQTKEDKQASLILLKLYYRKAKALEQMNNLTEAEENVRKGLTINSEDKDLQEYLKNLRRQQNKQVIVKLKEEAASLIKQSKIKEALENYSKCLKMLEEAEDIQQYLAILQNQCVCYHKIQKYDDVLSTCIRILKLVSRLEDKILEFGGKKQVSIGKEDLKKISVRTLVRRANAYIKTHQYYNAKSDLQRALEISPDESIKKELQNLKSRLSDPS